MDTENVREWHRWIQSPRLCGKIPFWFDDVPGKVYLAVIRPMLRHRCSKKKGNLFTHGAPGVHQNSFSLKCPCIPGSNWNLEMLVFEERGKPRFPEKNLSAQSREPINKLNPHMTPGPGIEPGPHWWEASALTTAPTLLPQNEFFWFNFARSWRRKDLDT